MHIYKIGDNMNQDTFDITNINKNKRLRKTIIKDIFLYLGIDSV